MPQSSALRALHLPKLRAKPFNKFPCASYIFGQLQICKEHALAGIPFLFIFLFFHCLTSSTYDSLQLFPMFLHGFSFHPIVSFMVTLAIEMQQFHLQRLDFLSERIIALAFDVVSHILETGPVSSFTVFFSSQFTNQLFLVYLNVH